MSPTSGSTDFSLNRDQLINAALRKIGNHNPDSQAIENGAEALNLIVKSLQSFRIFLWTSEWVTKTLTASTEKTGTDGNIYTCIRSHATATANKPITGSDYRSYWVERGSTGGSWSAGVTVTSINEFDVESDTLAIDKAFYRDTNSDNPIRIVSKDEFLDTYDKTVIGRPKILWLERKITPHVWLWPIPDLSTYIINMQRIRKLQDFDDGENTADFPDRWLEFLIYRLAFKLAPEYGLPAQERSSLKSEAAELFLIAKAGGREIMDEESVDSAY